MCKKLFAWLFPKPDPEPESIVSNKIALLFGIGSGYSGTQNDLIGPPYDLRNVKAFLTKNYPEFAVKVFQDTAVTRNSFETTIRNQLAVMKENDTLLIYYSGHGTNGIDNNEPDGQREGIYLTDGTYWDDEFTLLLQEIKQKRNVIIALDSCFAHGSTTPKELNLNVPKFVQTQDVPDRIKKLKRMLKSDVMNYIVFAACQEDETSADLGDEGGAFTKYWLKAWRREMTYSEWSAQTVKLMSADTSLDQIPNIEGDTILINKVVFS